MIKYCYQASRGTYERLLKMSTTQIKNLRIQQNSQQVRRCQFIRRDRCKVQTSVSTAELSAYLRVGSIDISARIVENTLTEWSSTETLDIMFTDLTCGLLAGNMIVSVQWDNRCTFNHTFLPAVDEIFQCCAEVVHILVVFSRTLSHIIWLCKLVHIGRNKLQSDQHHTTI